MPSLSHYCRPHLWAAVLAFGLAAASALAQSTVTVTDTTGWNPWLKPSDLSIVSDPVEGSGSNVVDDFVGDATNATFFQKAGVLAGVDSLLLRARLGGFTANNQWGSNSTISSLIVGIDINGNGSVDLLMRVSGSNTASDFTLTFGSPGAGANTSPSTTSWTWSATSLTPFTLDSQVAVRAADTAFNPKGGTTDLFLSFAVPFSAITAAVGTPSTFTMGYNTMLSFVAWTTRSPTSTAPNFQDSLGFTATSTTTTTWAALGATTAQVNSFGVIPEPATYAQLAALLLAGGVVAWRRRRARSSAAGPVPVE